MKFRKYVAALCAAVMVLACAGCGGDSAKVIPLNDEEKDIVAQMGEDVTVVTDEEWADTLTEIQAHPDVFNGEAYQLEGVYHKADTINGVETSTVSRTLVHGSEKTVCAIPLRERIDKDLPDGAWIRMTGFVQIAEYGGEAVSELMVVAVETLAEAGAAELTWNGSSHNHT